MAHDGDNRPSPAAGHNSQHGVRQWQTPHRPDEALEHDDHDPIEADLDLVETAFLESFPTAADPTSFLRMANIPFTGTIGDGRLIHLLRVETYAVTDVGAITPRLGGDGVRYDPLPAKMTSRRQTLALIYTDGETTVDLTLSQARALKPATS
ncbi:hypothetical protein [Bauldia sp.]|uniref:hypothetical protein n=1 Tax=Bauldia sp. TaxID=2575872 RepID=UPI003BA9ABED